jgi:hypothetical protein
LGIFVRYLTAQHLLTVLAVGLSLLILLGVPQISHILAYQLALPWEILTPMEGLVAALLWMFVLGSFFLYLLLVIVVVPRPAAQLGRDAAAAAAISIDVWILLYVPQLGREMARLMGAEGHELMVTTGLWLLAGGAFVVMVLRLVRLAIGPGQAHLPCPKGEQDTPEVPVRGSHLEVLLAWWVRIAEWMGTVGRRRLGLILVLTGLAWVAATVWLGWVVPDTLPHVFETPFHAGIGMLLVATGAWFVLAAWIGGPGRLGWKMTLLGRGLAFFWVVNVVDELLWWMPVWMPALFSFRNYTIWVIFQILFGLILLARVLDSMHLYSDWPVRQLALVTVLAALVVIHPQAVGRHEATGAPGREGEDFVTEQWFDALRQRMHEVPGDAPAVFVAGSGGGSRAALFTALVLEGLRSMPTGTGHTMDEQVVLISSVSGGSLATAYYVAPKPEGYQPERREWRNSIRGEVIRRMPEIAAEMLALHPEGGTFKSVAGICQKLAEAERPTKTPGRFSRVEKDVEAAPDYEWVINSTFVDDMCSDFMAPLLRGILLPILERGQSVSLFWERQFGWEGCTNLEGYGSAGSAPRRFRRPPLAPLVIFNACDLERGTRLAVGFPPLPPGLLGCPPEFSDYHVIDPGYPAVELMDLDTGYEVSLAEAVRLSANFPWGFEVAKITPRSRGSSGLLPRGMREGGAQPTDSQLPAGFPTPKQASAPGFVRDEVPLTDGGVMDNTGIDTVAQLFLRLALMAEAGRSGALGQFREDAKGKLTDDQVGRIERRALKVGAMASEILAELKRRGVIVMEIDSGAKPRKGGVTTAALPTVFEPLSGLENAGYANALFAKDGHLQALRLLSSLQDGNRPRVVPVRFECNHSEDVMTAWALGPADKALILVQFLVNYLDNRQTLLGAVLALKGPSSPTDFIKEEMHRAAERGRTFRQLKQGR